MSTFCKGETVGVAPLFMEVVGSITLAIFHIAGLANCHKGVVVGMAGDVSMQTLKGG